MSAGWWLGGVIFGLTGRPPELVAFLISIALGIILAGSTAFVIGRLTGRLNDDPSRIWNELGDAMDRIANGDFSVRLTSPRSGVMAEIVESVNNMAAGLGTVEQQRQEFISNVSHEIQSPLTSIGGFASLLRDGDLDEATRQHYLDVISAEVQRLSKLSDNLLRLSTLESGAELDRSRYSLDEQLRSIVLALEPQWTAKHLDVGLDAAPTEIEADADMLHQAWLNLVQNAIKYTPDGGRVRVTMRTLPDRVRVEVVDTGIGVAASDLPRVFERFFRADKARSGEGNGLGLSLVKRVVELHGGEVGASSRPGVGSTFSVTLPLNGNGDGSITVQRG
jgi:signal transduction histidine kinase